jgi:thiamine monophosphate synthase
VSDSEHQGIPTLRPFGIKGGARKPRTPAERREVIASHLPALMLVTDWSRLHGRAHGEVLREAAAGGANIVQMRDRLPVSMPHDTTPAIEVTGVPDDALPYVREVIATSTDSIILGAATLGVSVALKGTLVFVHSGGNVSAAATVSALDDLDEAIVGLHLPDKAISGFGVPPNARPDRHLFGESIIISRSVHSVEAAERAERDGADMLVLGTAFPSSSHPGAPTIGLDGVRAVSEAVSIPVIGIGGITAANAGDVIRAGASGVAVISAIFDADDPRAAAAELRTAIDAAWAEQHPSL